MDNILKSVSELESIVRELNIHNSYKSLLASCISSELFSIMRLSGVVILLDTKKENNRVFAIVKVIFKNNEINLFQCRPFIDKSAYLKIENGQIVITKSYFLYVE